MKIKICLILLLSITVAHGASPSANGEFNLRSLRKSSETFAANVYQHLAKQKGNILVSPSSLQTVLALTQMAANDQTLDEMAAALSLPKDKHEVQRAFTELLQRNRNIKYATFSSVNKVYVNEGFEISPKFSRIAAESFDAEIENKDFSKRKQSADSINQWVESKTNHKIKDLVDAEMISNSTEMILVNALYFNGGWDGPFDPRLTHKRDFYVTPNEKVKVDMMFNTVDCNFGLNDALGVEYLELPYAQDEFTMTFFLPTRKGTISKLERNIHEVLKIKTDEMENLGESRDIFLPKFKFEQNKIYNDILEELEMKQAFSNDANLKDFSINKLPVKISHVVQKTFIDVNEKGTEASAATGVFLDRIIGGRPPTFMADHPFLFVLRHAETGIVEFIGRYSGP